MNVLASDPPEAHSVPTTEARCGEHSLHGGDCNFSGADQAATHPLQGAVRRHYLHHVGREGAPAVPAVAQPGNGAQKAVLPPGGLCNVGSNTQNAQDLPSNPS